MNRKYYLAYGSNLNIAQMARRCPNAKPVGTAAIPDYRLLFKGSGTGAYLTIEPETGGKVPVGVWSVTAADELALDYYEGTPRFYYKTEMTLPVASLKTGAVTTRTAFVYIMREERDFGIPSASYVRTCLAGYRDFGFDKALLAKAIQISKEARR